MHTDIAHAIDLAREFQRCVATRDVGALDMWLQVASHEAAPREIAGFARSLGQDRDAVRAALGTPYSNGQVEGQINRLKLIRHRMYCRGKLDLLKHYVLQAA